VHAAVDQHDGNVFDVLVVEGLVVEDRHLAEIDGERGDRLDHVEHHRPRVVAQVASRLGDERQVDGCHAPS
jgi:hypothetical protein